MGVVSSIVPGQILYASNLNNNYANCVNVAGDSIQGNLYLNGLVANSFITINNIDIGSGLQNAYNAANAAFTKANTGGGGGGSGNSALASLTLIANTGLTVNTGTNITLTSNGTIILGANTSSTTQIGVVQLNDTTTSQSTSLAATANSVNTSMTYAQAAFNRANTVDGIFTVTLNGTNGIAIGGGSTATILSNGSFLISANTANTTQPGVVQLSDSVLSTSVTFAATANTVNNAMTYAQAAFTKANNSLSNVGNQIISGNVTVNGNISANNLIVTGTVNSSSIIINPIASNTNYILSNRDNGATLTFSNNNQTLVNVNNTLSIGFRCILTQIGTGNVVVQAGANVTINPVTGFKNQIGLRYASASLFCYASNTFILDGTLI